MKVNGYFWQDEIYCVSLEINQYNYDDIKSILSTVDEIEIKIGFEKEQTLSKSAKSEVNKRVLKTLINSDYASNYWGKPRNVTVYDKTDNWIDYSTNYLKIGVAEDGIYRIEYEDLVSIGVNINMLVPKTLKMFMKGEEQLIFVNGEDDNVFDPADFIEFVGIRNMGGKHRELSGYDEPYNEYLGRYTDTTIYWLTWDGVDGKRVQISDGNLSTLDTLDYYNEIIHSEKNGWFDFSVASLVRRETPFWIENKTWNEGNLEVGTKQSNFIVSNVYPNKTANIYAKLQDQASSISTKAHLVAVSLNKNTQNYDSTYIDKYEKVVLDAQLNSNELINGSNTFKIHSFPTNNTVNRCVFDWYEIEYPRYLMPINSSLVFSFSYLEEESLRAFKLNNIESENFSLWKYGKAITKYSCYTNKGEIVVSDLISPKDKYLYTEVLQIKSPKFYYLKQFVNLRKSENMADYILITHKKFRNKVNEYANFISSNYSVETKIIDMDDIYDEYSYGFFNPEAIKEFLSSTYKYWQSPKPSSVFLVGGATYDYYGNKNKYTGVSERVLNYVPSYGASVSDNWFVIWDSTGAYIPQMNIGRLPVTTDEEFDWYFEKHKNYLTQVSDDWNKRYMFFSGGKTTSQSELDQMREANQFVIDNYVTPKPIGGKSEHFYKTIEPPTNFGPFTDEYLKNAVDDGGVFISYLGHSGTQTWDNSIVNPVQLKNSKNRYPIVTDFGCSTGRFAEPDVISFSQLFTIGHDGQALAYIGNASLGFVSTSITMPKLFYKKILSENILTVSEAHKQAKLEMLQTYGSTGIYELFALTNTLIGDPLLALPVPDKPNLVLNENDFVIVDRELSDLQDSAKAILFINNFGKVIDDSIDILIIHQFESKTDSIFFDLPMSFFRDSIEFRINIKNSAGNHLLRFMLDPQNSIDEINENDNILEFSFYVAPSSLRLIMQYLIENGVNNNLKLLNPSKNIETSELQIELSDDDSFSLFTTVEKSLDTIVTNIDLNLERGKRYWGRTKLKGSENSGKVFSFYNLQKSKFLLIDSISANGGSLNSLNNKGFISIDTSIVKFELFSAGFNDGNTAVLKKDGINYIPESTIPGHHVALFTASQPYEFVEYHYFNTLVGGNEITRYNALLDTVS
ncbi:MAG: hypothetical protein COW71_08235, partial [Ignavibacteriales bacterium CG18_big_fil_WC_8_21_14_2_50_31_20]